MLSYIIDIYPNVYKWLMVAKVIKQKSPDCYVRAF